MAARPPGQDELAAIARGYGGIPAPSGAFPAAPAAPAPPGAA